MEKIAIATFYTTNEIVPGDTLSMFFDAEEGELRVTHVENVDMAEGPRLKITGEVWGGEAVREKAKKYEIFQMMNRVLADTSP